ncbi:MAG: hypothetical protein QXX58_04205 [Thermofilaceae archaeon]
MLRLRLPAARDSRSAGVAGVSASVENVNDMVAARREVSGTAASFRWNYCFLRGTLLVNADLDALSRLPEARGREAVR